MTFKLSATMMQDVLSCSMKGYYRTEHPDYAIQTKEMLIGSIVHKAIENGWMNENVATLEVNKSSVGLSDEIVSKSTLFVDNFFKYFKQYTSSEDKIEEVFNIIYSDDVVLTGKLDRVNVDLGILLDWKTGAKTPSTLKTNIQFILYNYAFRKLYGKEPNLVAYASLSSGKLVKYLEDHKTSQFVFTEVIPKVSDIIKNKRFSREGVFAPGAVFPKVGFESYTCHYCAFREACLGGGESSVGIFSN